MSKKHKSDKKQGTPIEDAKDAIKKAAKKVTTAVKTPVEKPEKAKPAAKPAAKSTVKPAPTPAPKPVAKIEEKPAKAPVAPAKATKKPEEPAAMVAPKETPKAKTTKSAIISNDDIGLRAYFIAEKRQKAGLPGDTASDWIEAERQLMAEAGQPKSAAAPKKPAKKG